MPRSWPVDIGRSRGGSPASPADPVSCQTSFGNAAWSAGVGTRTTCRVGGVHPVRVGVDACPSKPAPTQRIEHVKAITSRIAVEQRVGITVMRRLGRRLPRRFPCEENALQKTPVNTKHVCRFRPVLTRFVPGFPGRNRGGCRYGLAGRIRRAGSPTGTLIVLRWNVRVTRSHGENRGSSPLGSANNINDLYFENLPVSRPCPSGFWAREREPTAVALARRVSVPAKKQATDLLSWRPHRLTMSKAIPKE